MIQQRSDQIIEGSQQDIQDTQSQNTQITQSNNHPFEWSRVLENISVVALQKFTSQTIGVLSDKTCKIERKIKPPNKVTCLTILKSQQKNQETQMPSIITPRKKVQSKAVQFFTGHFDGTITLWVVQNNKVKKMKVFSDIEPSNRRPVSCLNVMTFQQSIPVHFSKKHFQEKQPRYRGLVQQPHKTQLSVVVQYVLLSGHQNGNVKQWNILTGQCLKEIETKHNGILFCVASIQETVLTGGYDNIQVHQRANSLPSFSSIQQQTSQTTSTNLNSNKVSSNNQEDSKISEDQDSSFISSQMRKKSWSNQREEERGRQIKKEFKVIHKGFANYQLKPNSTTQKEEKVVRNMVALGSNSIVSHGFSNDVTEWKLDSNKITKKIYTGHTDNVKCIEKLNNSSFITGGRDSNVIIWDKNSNQNQIYEGAHSQPVNSLSAMNEKSFDSSGEDKQILFWKQPQ